MQAGTMAASQPPGALKSNVHSRPALTETPGWKRNRGFGDGFCNACRRRVALPRASAGQLWLHVEKCSVWGGGVEVPDASLLT